MINFEVEDSNIIYISQFGSYGTEEWVEYVSDIDIGVVVNSLEELDCTLEDRLTNDFKKMYKYDNINITIVEYDLDVKLVRNIICGKTIFSRINEKDIKTECLYIEKMVQKQREYYEAAKLEKLKDEVNELW